MATFPAGSKVTVLTKIIRIPLAIVFVLSLVLVTPSASPLSAKTAGERSINSPSLVAATVVPVADAYVDSSNPTANYGTGTTLRVDGSPIVNSYLRFSVPTVSGTITKVTLRVYANSSQSTGYTVYRVADNSWGETTINYSNAPALGSGVGSSGAVSSATWTAVDVTSYITGSGTWSLALATSNVTALSLASRESGSNAPQLVIEMSVTATATFTSAATSTNTTVPATATNTATKPPSTSTATATSTSSVATATATRTATATFTGAATATATTAGGGSTLTLSPVADAYVNASSPGTNYGTSTQLKVDGSPILNSYLRFSVQGLSGPGVNPRLRLCALASSSTGVSVRGVSDNSWGETTITYLNAPPFSSTVIGTSGALSKNKRITVDVTSYITGNGTWSVAVTTGNANGKTLASREAGANGPQLIVQVGGTATPVPATNTPTVTTVPATATNTPTSTPTNTATNTPLPPTATDTPLPPTATATNTALPPTATNTSLPPTATDTPVLPTATNTPTPSPTSTMTPTLATPSTTPTPSLTPAPSFQPAPPIEAGFFYPWFPQSWTQLGIYPYTNYHPSLGYYSSTDDAIIDQQLTLIQQAHFEAMISSWWGQGHNTDTAFGHILGRSERSGSPYPDLRWSIYYENESQGDPTVTQIVSDLQYLANNYFSQPGYLRVNGKPVVFVYADANDACGMADRWVQAKGQVGGNVYIVLKVFAGYATCASQPDSWHQYAPAVGFDQQGKFSAVASPGFWKVGESPRLSRDPTRFESDVKKVVASSAFWQLITTWNEWGEGTSVEPATEWGNTYIDILCRNLPGSTSCSGLVTPTPTTTPTAMPTPTSTPLAFIAPSTPTAARTSVQNNTGLLSLAPNHLLQDELAFARTSLRELVTGQASAKAVLASSRINYLWRKRAYQLSQR